MNATLTEIFTVVIFSILILLVSCLAFVSLNRDTDRHKVSPIRDKMSAAEKNPPSSPCSEGEDLPLITVVDTDKPANNGGPHNNNNPKRRKLPPHLVMPAAGDSDGGDTPLLTPQTPAAKVLNLLSEKDDPEDDYDEENDIFSGHSVFCQMDMLCYDQDGSSGWKEMARWLKYEEKVDDGDRWSKPHVSTTSLHSLVKIKDNFINNETVLILDLDASAKSGNKIADVNTKQLKPSDVDLPSWKSLVNVAESVTSTVQKEKGLTDNQAKHLMEALLRQHKHKHRKGKGKKAHHEDPDGQLENGGKLNKVRSFAKKDDLDEMSKKEEMYPSGVRPDDLSRYKPNKKMMKKIPGGSESASILIGQIDTIDKPISVFVRLATATVLSDLTEVSLPTRFLYLLIGPREESTWSEREMGRSVATLLTDKIFCQVAYKGRSRQDLIDGIEEFMDDLTVLPPSIWDPSTRLEPPSNAVSENAIRKRLDPSYHAQSPDAAGFESHEDEDDSLNRTRRLFGGLIKDVKRRYASYVSDITDAIHTQSIASIFFMFFACITPIVTFGGLMGDKTDQYMGVMENILSGAICGFLYALFSGQPLTIVGATGPLLVFESIVYTMCKGNDWEFLPFRFWIGMWCALLLFIIVLFDLSFVVRYITRFTEESFSVLISLIFIYEAVHKVVHVWSHHPVETTTIDKGPDYSCFCVPANTPNATQAPPTTTTTTTTIATTTADFNSSLINATEPITTTPIPIFTDFFNWTTKDFPDHCFVHESKILFAHDCIVSESECFQHGWAIEGSACSDHAIGHYEADVALLSTFLFLGTFGLAYFLRTFRTSSYFPTIIRSTLADFCVLISIIVWTSIDISFGINTDKLIVPSEFKTTNPDREWVVNPFGMKPANWWLAIMAAVPAFLATILIFLDQQITAVIVNRKEHKLKKGHGYHLDLFVLAFLIMICSLFGLPWFVAATVRSITHVRSLFMESETKAPGEKPNHIGVREQRLTGIVIHIMIGCSVLLTSLLKFIPMPVLYGVFMYMGVTSLSGVQFVERILLFIQPAKYQPDYIYLRHVPTFRIHIFSVIQILCMAGMWVIKMNPTTAIGFPVMLLVLCVVRKVMDYVFTQSELYWLDHLFPDETRKEMEDEAKYALEEGNGGVIQLQAMDDGMKKKGGPLDPEKFETRPRSRSIEIIKRYDQAVSTLPEREKTDAL